MCTIVCTCSEQVINDQSVRLYLIPGVPEDTPFGPRSRCEIKEIRWFDINSLPLLKADQVGIVGRGASQTRGQWAGVQVRPGGQEAGLQVRPGGRGCK